MGAHTRMMPAHRREAIEAEIEGHLQRVTILIARLDRADEPWMDMEDDDPAGGAIEDDHRGEGVGDHGRGLLLDRPRYGIDQSGGPINYKAAEQAYWRRRMRIA